MFSLLFLIAGPSSSPPEATNPLPPPDPNPVPTSTSTVLASQQTEKVGMDSLQPTPTHSSQSAAVLNPPEKELSLGLIAGVAAGAGVAATSVLLLFLFIIVTKWRSTKRGSSHDWNEAMQPPNVEAASFNHTFNGSSSKKLEVEFGQNHSRQGNGYYSEDTHRDVATLSNDAYGISFPKLQDDDLYENIDSLATMHMFVPEADNHLSTTPLCEIIPTVSLDLSYGDRENELHHEYADIMDVINMTGYRVAAGGHTVTPGVVTDQAHGEETEESLHDYTDIIVDANEALSGETTSDHTTKEGPAVLSSNLAHGIVEIDSTEDGPTATSEHIDGDVPEVFSSRLAHESVTWQQAHTSSGDGISPRTASHDSGAHGDMATISAYQAYGAAVITKDREEQYPDAIGDSVQRARSPHTS